MSNPLQPSPSLLSKLGSIIVHADELNSPGGHAYDLTALQFLYSDSEVVEWLNQMRKMAMIPVKR